MTVVLSLCVELPQQIVMKLARGKLQPEPGGSFVANVGCENVVVYNIPHNEG
jgi:hypothetical protein